MPPQGMAKPWHMVAFSESVDQALLPITPVADGQLQTGGDDLVLDEQLLGIWGLWVGSANCERAQLFVPSFLDTKGILPDILPVDGDPTPTGTGHAPLVLWDPPFAARKGERINLRVENDAAAAAERVNAIMLLGPSFPSPSPGRWWPLRATIAAAALTANVWNAGRSMTLDQSLPPGTYELGGALVRSTSAVAARFSFPGQGWLPGCLGHPQASLAALATSRDYVAQLNGRFMTPFRNGALGSWGRFTHDQPAQVQLFPNAADNEIQDLILDVRRVA